MQRIISLLLLILGVAMVAVAVWIKVAYELPRWMIAPVAVLGIATASFGFQHLRGPEWTPEQTASYRDSALLITILVASCTGMIAYVTLAK